MAENSWTIAGTHVDGVETTDPSPQRGGELTLACEFDERSEAATGRDERYDAIKDYLAYAHTVRHGVDAEGEVWFRLDTNTNDPVESHVVSVDPGEDVDVEGFWGLVVGGDPQSDGPWDVKPLDLELVYIAPLSDYADRDAVESALGESI